MKKYQKKANEIAREHDFDCARYLLDFEGKEVYKPVYKHCKHACIGLPISIVVDETTEEYYSGDKGLEFYKKLPFTNEDDE